MKEFTRKDDKAVSPVIAVILMVAITVVLAGVLYVWVTTFNTPTPPPSSVSLSINEKAYGWEIEVISVSGTFNLEDAKFRINDEFNFRLWERDLSEAQPPAFKKGESKAYTVPTDETGSNDVDDGKGNIIDATHNPGEYQNCSVAYIDQENNDRLSAGNRIYIYKDNNNDGANEVLSGYKFELLYKDKMVAAKML